MSLPTDARLRKRPLLAHKMGAAGRPPRSAGCPVTIDEPAVSSIVIDSQWTHHAQVPRPLKEPSIPRISSSGMQRVGELPPADVAQRDCSLPDPCPRGRCRQVRTGRKAVTGQETADLRPSDRIVIQSFIWVVKKLAQF